MKKYEPILDRAGNLLFSSEEVARAALPYETSSWNATGIAFKTSEGYIYDVRGFDLDRGLCIAYSRNNDLTAGGGF